MKGVILAGGNGARLLPLTKILNKHLLPVYDRAMIEYPLSTLRRLGADEILVVTGERHKEQFLEYFKHYNTEGFQISFAYQMEPAGIANALSYAEKFASGQDILVVLGDNIFSPQFPLPPILSKGFARIWKKWVPDASRFGVISAGDNQVIQEKPAGVGAGHVVLGLYQYPSDVFDVIRQITPSSRGELEITDVNNWFLQNNRCEVIEVPRETFWIDAGTHESLLESSRWAADPARNGA